MLIDVPVTITFDHDSRWRAGQRSHSRIFTMRYDTEDNDAPAQYCLQYPPPDKARWSVDKDGILFDLFTSDADSAIKKAAAADPVTYCVDAAEGLRLECELEESREANSQFGVGA